MIILIKINKNAMYISCLLYTLCDLINAFNLALNFYSAIYKCF